MIRRFVLGVVVAVLLFAPHAARGQTGEVVNSWALSPTGVDANGESTRSYLTYSLAPGDTVRDSVTLWNYSNVQLTFDIYPSDARNNSDGAFGLPPSTDKPADVGSWITLPQAHVTANPNSKIDIPITVTVPKDARPGDHSGAVLAANAVRGTGADGKSITLDRRTGTRVYIRVKGVVTPALTVENVHTVYHPSWNPLSGTMDVTYTVRNAGNVRLSAHQVVEGSGLFGLGKKTVKPKDVPELLPNNAVTLHAKFKGVPASFLVTNKVTLTPFTAAKDVEGLSVVSRTGRSVAIPWTLILAGLAYWGYRRLRRWQHARQGSLVVAVP